MSDARRYYKHIASSVKAKNYGNAENYSRQLEKLVRLNRASVLDTKYCEDSGNNLDELLPRHMCSKFDVNDDLSVAYKKIEENKHELKTDKEVLKCNYKANDNYKSDDLLTADTDTTIQLPNLGALLINEKTGLSFRPAINGDGALIQNNLLEIENKKLTTNEIMEEDDLVMRVKKIMQQSGDNTHDAKNNSNNIDLGTQKKQ